MKSFLVTFIFTVFVSFFFKKTLATAPNPQKGFQLIDIVRQANNLPPAEHTEMNKFIEPHVSYVYPPSAPPSSSSTHNHVESKVDARATNWISPEASRRSADTRARMRAIAKDKGLNFGNTRKASDN